VDQYHTMQLYDKIQLDISETLHYL